jgi:RHS repeat-associated protein
MCYPLAVVLVVGGLTVPAGRATAQSPEPVRYAYDAAGRLTGVTDPAGDAAAYGYDGVGNLTGITRRDSTQVTVLGLTPTSGAPGAEVTITGTGFATDPADNEVTIGGTDATVVEAAPTQLVVTVPAGAGSGPVTVETAAGSADSPGSFTVEDRPAPAISGFSPADGAPGDPVTITGTGFDRVLAHNVVEFNGIRARVTAATTTSLTAVVPGTGSGRIAVRTPGGVATSTARFTVGPTGYPLAEVGATADLTVDGAAQPLAVAAAGDVGLLRFDGVRRQRVSLVLTNNTYGGSVSVRLFTATNTELSGNQFNAAYQVSGNTSIGLPELPDTGTYQVVVDPNGATGSIDARVVADVAGGVLPENAGTAVENTLPGQRVRLRLAATAGRSYSLGITGSTGTGSHQITVFRPDGAVTVASATFSTGNGVLNTGAVPVTGTYQVVILAPTLLARSFTVTVAGPVDFGALSLTGAGTVVTTTLAGQTARLRFDATQGELRSLALTGSTLGVGTVTVIRPEGGQLGSYTFSGAASEVDLPRLPSTGTYDVIVAPSGTTTGSATVTLAADVTAGALDPAGPGVAVATTRFGQNARLTFDGVAGERISLAFTGSTFTGAYYAYVFGPDGTAIVNQYVSGSDDVDLAPLPQTGSYQLVVDPAATSTGSMTVTLSRQIDGGTLALTGAGAAVSVARPGQNVAFRFDGTAGQRLSLGFTGSTFGAAYYLTVVRPDGTTMVNGSYIAAGDNDHDLAALTLTGQYQVRLDFDVRTGAMTVTLGEDVDGGVLDPAAPGSAVSVARPGQNVRFRFDGTAGQRVSLGFTGSTFGAAYYLTVVRPDGTTMVNGSYIAAGDNDYDLDALAATGTYTVVLDYGYRTGAMTVTFSRQVDGGVLSPTAAGTAVSVARPGQNVGFRFDGTAGERLSLGFTGSTFGAAYYLTVVRPDGTTMVNGSYIAAGDNDYELAPLPLSGLYDVRLAFGHRTGAMTVTFSRQVDGGVLSPTAAGTSATVSRPGQDAGFRFDGTAGQRVSLGFTGSTFGAAYYLTVLRPDGTTLVNGTYLAAGTNDYDLDLTVAGTYTVILDFGTRTGAMTVTFSVAADAGVLAVGGAAVPVGIARSGQDARLRFTGATGQVLTFTFSGSTFGGYYELSVVRPDGTRHLNARLLTGNTSTTLAALTVTGEHTVIIDPQSARTGSTTVALTAPAVSGALAAEPPGPGDPQPAAPETAGRPAADPERVPVAAPIPAADLDRPGVRPAPQLDTNGRTDGWVPDRANVAGVDWNTRLPRPAPAPEPARADRGVTALAGHVRAIDGLPLHGVSVSIGDARASTGADGRFLLTNPPAGRQKLVVDANRAGRPAGDYGRYEIGVDLAAGQTTDLPYPIWLTRLDRERTAKFPSPTTREVVLTTPKIPGLEVRLPAGSVVRDASGRVIRELSLTAIPVDRPPFPLPRHIRVPVYFTVQPGGTYLFPQGAQVIYPNYTDEAPGTRVEFWNYEPAGRGWYVYGHGTVTRDGRQVVPDPDVRVYSFTGSMINAGLNGPAFGPNQDFIDWISGDPVDLGTGLMVDQHTDLTLPDVLPISVTRTYRQADDLIRPFGTGQNHEYGIFLQSANQYTEADLVLPDGAKVHYERISSGSGFSDAVFRNDTSATDWYRSTITWNGNGWNLTRRDGMTYVFGDESPLQAIRDRHGNQITITRQGSGGNAHRGNITRVTSPGGKWIAFGYDTANRVSRVEDNIGRSVSYTYDTAGWLHTVTDPGGKTTTYGYDANRRLTSIRDPRGITYLANVYDAAGRVQRQTLPEGAVYEFAYQTDEAGRITATEVTDPNDRVRRVTFNAAGFAVTDTAAHGTALAQTKTLERDPATNRVTAVVDQLARRTTFGYDAAGNVEQVTMLAGTLDEVTTRRAYGGPANQVSAVTDGLGHTTRYEFDAAGNVARMIDPENRAVTFTYRPDGQPATVADPRGKTTTYGYQLDDLVTTTDPLGRTGRQHGDAAGRVLERLDAAGGRYRFAYDARNLPTSVTDPLGNTTGYAYDDNGNLETRTDARAHATSYSYDDADRIETVTDPLGRASTRTYDPDGNVRTVTDRRGKVTRYDYDELDRLVTMAYGVTGTTAESTVTLRYDAGNRMTGIVDSAGGTVTQEPDQLDRLIEVTTAEGAVEYDYDDAGRRTGMRVTGQPPTGYGYNDANQLTSITRGGTTVGLGYDDAGRPRTRTLPGGTAQTYSYDDADQLTGITYTRGGATLGDLTYTYDAAGRRSSVGGSYARTDLPAALTGAVYDDADRLTSLGGTAFSYDDEGNLTGDGATAYAWNARGQLASLSRTGISAAFTYDGLGRRTGRTVNGALTRYLYDGDNVVQELNGSGPTANMITGGTDVQFARSDASGEHDVLTDALGSVVGLTDTAGAVATSYTYEPFGAASADGAAGDNSTQFTARDNDGTGLYYHRARYYHPALQRFISQDPIGHEGGGNLYAYAANSPTNYTDPTGHLPFLVVIAGAFIVGALIDGAISYGTQRLSGRKVDWGWNGVLGDAVIGGVVNAATAGFGKGFTLVDDVADIARYCKVNSFTPPTRVTMADGTSKPIAEVSVGDLVLATDPATGETGPRRVTDVIAGDGTKDLVDLTIDGQVVTATGKHPFYDTVRRHWVDAEDVAAGDRLRTPSGAVEVEQVRRYVAVDQPVFNLTVAGLHTYHVQAGETPVLVHNCRDVPRLDGSGKIHTHGSELPAHVPAHWTTEDLIDLADDLRTSIATRKAEQLRLGEDGPHRRRIAEEERLLRQIEKILSGS